MNFHGEKKTRHNSGASISKRFLSCHNLVLLGLHSLWKNPPDEDLADTFNTPRETIRDTKKKLFPIMERCLNHFIKISQSPPRFDDGPLKGAALVIDTTPTPIPKPSSREDQKLYFNFKKKHTRYAMKTQCVVGLDLKIWHVSKTYPHSVHDLTVLRDSSALEFISAEKKGLGDSAYVGEKNMIVPFKKPPQRTLRRNQKLFNKQVSHVRITVENVFKRVKDFKIITQTYRGDYHNLDEFNCIFKLVCALVNLMFEKHPLYRQMRSIKDLPDSI
jgi:hypothetical protein